MSLKWKDVKREIQREAIIKAAKNLFSRKGYLNVTMDEIASEAGLSKATLYKFFPSKHQLYREILQTGFQEFVEKLMSIQASDFREKFERIINAVIDYISENQQFFKLLITEVPLPFEGKREDFFREVTKRRQKTIHFLEALLQEGRKQGYIRSEHIHELAIALLSLMKGFFFELTFLEGRDMDDYRDFIINTCWKLVKD